MQLQDVHETAGRIFLIQELCEGGNLLDVIRDKAPLCEEQAAGIFRGIIKSVLHCHQARPCPCLPFPNPDVPTFYPPYNGWMRRPLPRLTCPPALPSLTSHVCPGSLRWASCIAT